MVGISEQSGALNPIIEMPGTFDIENEEPKLVNVPQDSYTAPPPGRARMTLTEVRTEWVDSLPNSTTRQDIWQKFEEYLRRFAEIEEKAIASGLLAPEEEIVKFLWLGGSFISDKVSPCNIDATIFLDGVTVEKLKGKRGSGWISQAFSRDKLDKSPKFSGITPIRVDYFPVISVFQLDSLHSQQRDYLLKRGAWDEWWQRLRDKETLEPTESSAATRRGYIEVVL